MLNKLIARWCFFICLSLTSTAVVAEGKPFDLSAYKGKVVMVDFWASWCGPCRQSFPWLNEMKAKKEAQGLVILGVSVDENLKDAKKFLAKTPADFEIIYDPKGKYASYYDIPGMPTTLIFDREGKLQHQHAAFKLNKIAEYEQLIDQALAASK